ncbi:protein MENT [Liasis olivaceus]
MAPGRALPALALVLVLACWRLPTATRAQDDDDTLISAPSELLALLPGAAKATVSAGFISGDQEEQATKEVPLLPQVSTRGPYASSSGKEVVLIVGDTRYAWQEWSQWHCNCHAGSMARVRDITYSVPGVRLDPLQYDILRFEREVCSYTICSCSRKRRDCDQLALTCGLGPMHMCALRDIQQDQDEKRRSFWGRVHTGLKHLWRSLKEAFPADKKAIQVKSRH